MSCCRSALLFPVLLWLGSGCVDPGQSGIPPQLSHVSEVSQGVKNELGKSTFVPPGEIVAEAPQTEALVFVGGHYVPAPYTLRVSVPDRHLYLNNEMAVEFPFATGGYRPDLPPIPAGIDASSSWQDVDDLPDDTGWWPQVYCNHFFSVDPPDVAAQKFVAALQTLPFYERHQWFPETGPRRVLRVYTKKGDKRDYFSGRWNPDSKEPGFEYVRELTDLRPFAQQGTLVKDRLDESARYFKSNIDEGQVVISGRETNGWIRIQRDNKRWYQIVNAVRILKSSLPAAEKVNTIYRRLSSDEWEDDLAIRQKQPEWQAVAELVKNFQPHPQLDERIAELEKSMLIPLWSPPADAK